VIEFWAIHEERGERRWKISPHNYGREGMQRKKVAGILKKSSEGMGGEKSYVEGPEVSICCVLRGGKGIETGKKDTGEKHTLLVQQPGDGISGVPFAKTDGTESKPREMGSGAKRLIHHHIKAEALLGRR